MDRISKKLLEQDTRCYDCGGRVPIVTKDGKTGPLCPTCGFDPYAEGPDPRMANYRDGHYNAGDHDGPPPSFGPSYPRQEEARLREQISLDAWYNKNTTAPVGNFVSTNGAPRRGRPEGPNVHSTSGQAYVIPDSGMSDDARRELWNLKDWRVSSVTGGAIWLVPQKEFEPFR